MVPMAGRGRGASQNVPNDLLAHMVAALQQNPSHFQGGFAPDAANEWIQNVERIFRAMGCSDVQKVTYASYMLMKEAETWWEFT
ncbi:hypothetical protein Lal_00043597 [Lupinus albus]|nr:hypothetical protein Lal_00043597 [Lupinus albus]